MLAWWQNIGFEDLGGPYVQWWEVASEYRYRKSGATEENLVFKPYRNQVKPPINVSAFGVGKRIGLSDNLGHFVTLPFQSLVT